MQKRCTKGKSCGATCIVRSDRCVIELGPLVSESINQVRSKLGVVKLYAQVKDQYIKGFQQRFNKVRGNLKGELGHQIRKTADVLELKRRLQEDGLLPKTKKSENLGDIFAKQIDAGKKAERPKSLPADLKAQLAGLGGAPMAPRQLSRSPGAATRTAPEVRRELANIAQAAKKGDMTLMMDDISRMMRGSLPIPASAISGKPGSASGGTQWARDSAGDFDKSFKIYKRIRGDKDMIDWDETVKRGQAIGEGSFGSVLKLGNMAVKRGEVSGTEAEIIKRVGEAGIGPKLYGAEISTKRRAGYGVDLHNGRIAMSVVPGKELGEVSANTKFANKNAADIYWKSMADLHRLGIAHNDAHPGNILVDKKGTGRWVDMGFAQQSPKAALAEALGAFSKSTKEMDGNWQTQSWDATGVPGYMQAQRSGQLASYLREYPVLSRVSSNNNAVQYQLLNKYGLSRREVDQLIDHGIRSDLSEYNQGVWKKLSDKQAQDLLNQFYDGI